VRRSIMGAHKPHHKKMVGEADRRYCKDEIIFLVTSFHKWNI
jgi:hypothetical protein